MKPIIITIANHKGGVGKTTTAVTLATGLADLGKITVLIDADSQGNVADFLALEKKPDLWRFIVQERPPHDVIQRVPDYPLLAVITGNEQTRRIENELNSGGLAPACAFKDALRQFENGGRPHVIVIDTAPTLTAVQVSALNAANWLLIPTTPEFASETGTAALVQAVADLQASGSNLQLLGILPTMVRLTTIEHQETLKDLEATFAGMILPPIRQRIALGEAPRHGLPIWKYDTEAAIDYALAVDQVRRRLGL